MRYGVKPEKDLTQRAQRKEHSVHRAIEANLDFHDNAGLPAHNFAAMQPPVS
jgi:hypothetical protein